MLKKSYWTVFSTIAFAIQSFVTNKFFSIYFGPVGVTLLAHFQNIIAIFVALPSEGINKAVSKNIANPNLNQVKYNATISSSILLIGICYFVILILFILLFRFYKSDFPIFVFDTTFIFLLLIALVLHIFVLYIGNLLLSSNLVKIFSILGIINNSIGIGIVYVGLQLGIKWALIFVAFSPCLLIFASYYYYKKNTKFLSSSFTFQLEKANVKEMYVFIWAAVGVVAFGKLTDFFVRSYIISIYSSYQTGLWQAVSKISDGYSTVFMAAFGTLIFVKLSALINEEKLLAVFLRKIIFFVFIGIGFLLLLLWFFKENALVLFYNKDFIPAQNLFTFQCLGDVFKFQFLILSNVLLIQLRTKLYVVLYGISAILYILFIVILSNYMAIESVNIAHFIRWLTMALIIFYIYRKVIFQKI